MNMFVCMNVHVYVLYAYDYICMCVVFIDCESKKESIREKENV